MKKKDPQAGMMATVFKERQKVSKSRKKYATIVSMPEMFKYLIGEKIRVVPGDVPGRIYGVVQKEGYDGLALAFEDKEIEWAE